MNIALTRVDSRLLHGQVLLSWVPATGANLIVVANDALAKDTWRVMFMKSSVTNEIRLQVSRVDELPAVLEAHRQEPGNGIVLFENVKDAWLAYEAGVAFAQLNLGNVHAHDGSRQVSPTVFLNDEDVGVLRKLQEKGVAIEIRAVSRDKSVPASSFLR